VVADPAQKLHAAQPPGQYIPARLALLGPRARDEQPAVATRLAQDPVGLEQVDKALAVLQAAHEQQVSRPVLPARKRNRAAVELDVDAVRDDLVVAREIAVDEVARGRAD